MIELDGSQGEGGGQIVRTALALAAYTQKAVRVVNIRAGRDKPGLKAQHLAGIKALIQLCNGAADGAELGSTELTFYPQRIKGGNIEVDIGTAGSITLLMQTVMLPALFAEKSTKFTIVGGTDTSNSMPIDYFSNVFVPHLFQWSEKIELNMLRRGYFPKGGGKVEISVKPKEELDLKPFDLINQGELMAVKGVSHASKTLEDAEVVERQTRSVQTALSQLGLPVHIRSEYNDTYSTGSGVVLWAIYSTDPEEMDMKMPIRLGADKLGEKGVPAETVGKNAANMLLDTMESEAPVDYNLADNLIPYLAIAGGHIKVEKITEHTRTNVNVVNTFFNDCLEIDETKKIIRRVKPV
jgi:RNA 3'-phosphate cyclase